MNTKQLIEKYHQAWTNGDFLTARDCLDRKSTRLNSSHITRSRMPSSA